MSVFQTIYVSVATELLKLTDLSEILTRARESNTKLGISGLLIFHENTFVQVLEGPRAGIESLLKKIELDPRHKNMKILLQKEIEEKEFDQWAMGFFNSALLTSRPVGFVDLSTELSTMLHEETTAQKALLRFMDGNYKKFVES